MATRKTKGLKIVLFLVVFGVICYNITWIIRQEPVSFSMMLAQANKKGIPEHESSLNVEDIKHRIRLINKEEKIYNAEKFGPLLNDSLVIVVQVHSRILYLKHLISSLREAKDISNVLLIFSHDYFDEEINNLIRSIDFCKVMQIFYPYSIQLYPRKFPGSDDKNCSSNMTLFEGKKDSFNSNGKYARCRNPSRLQVKHHWWWKANRIFNLRVAKKYEKVILFLEDDFYLVEDFISVVKLMEGVAKEYCQNCKTLSLAIYTNAIEMNSIMSEFYNTVTISNELSNTMGLAFNRSTWMEIIQCKDSFCLYNEHNWDFSLKHVLTTCMQNVMAMIVNVPRVYHLGTCGMHFKSNNCDSAARLQQIKSIITNYKTALYPNNLKIILRLSSHPAVGGPYGGWSDTRDQALCLQMVKTYKTNYLT